MADNFGGGENIFYIDDANIVLIDPNAIIDSDGRKKDRVIKQENLVMYANLEVESVPRTKLSVGQSVDSGISNYTIASINFLKPQGKNVFDTSYTDQLTAGRNLQGTVNQLSFDKNDNPQQLNYVDTQLLGIKSINVDIKNNGVPTVSMTLVDIQGRALFETGGNSPYSVFLYYPYPLFRLTLKGYYGKAIQYELMLRSFNASFEQSTGNYNIDLQFIARTSAILDDIRLGYLFALPNMYPRYEVPVINSDTTSQQATASQQQIGVNVAQQSTIVRTSRGYNKIKEVFEEYKKDGLIDSSVPIMTLNEMQINLSKYTQFLNDEFEKLPFEDLVALQKYKETVDTFSTEIEKWRTTYTDNGNILVLTDKTKMYQLKNLTINDESSNTTKSNTANAELEKILNNNKGILETIPRWSKEIAIPDNFFKITNFQKKFTEGEIDYIQTFFNVRGRVVNDPINDEEFLQFKDKLKNRLIEEKVLPTSENSDNSSVSTPNPYYYTFDLFSNDYINLVSVIEQNNQKENERLNGILQDRVKKNGNVNNLPFRPTIRNVVGVIIASVDAFYRLMDEIHEKAWNERDNPDRIRSIISNDTPSPEGKNSTQTTTKNITNFVYPWPQFVQKKEGSGNSEYQITYPGSKSVLNFTNGYDTRVWPEVEFVEQFLYGLTVKDLDYNSDNQISPTLKLNYTPSSAIEFEYVDKIYSNTAVYDFVYEMYERLLLNTYYSGLYYSETNFDLINSGSDMEYSNISNSGLPNGELKKILSDQLTKQNLYDFLKSTSGQNNEGQLWNNFLTQSYNTGYIIQKIKEQSELYSDSEYKNLTKNPIKLTTQDTIVNFLKDPTSSNNTLMDTYPFIIPQFQQKLPGATSINFYDTINTYTLDSQNLFITNQKNNLLPLTKNSSALNGYNNPNIGDADINGYFNTNFSNPNRRMVTEGNVFYSDNNRLTETQTTSMLNTPYFLNSLMESSELSGDTKYVKPAYLLLNSLPLTTLYERYLDIANNVKDEYIFASLNKFSAIHKLPYAWILKIGSVWYRYKEYVNNNVDILDSIWKDFNYKKAYDPQSSNDKKVYSIIQNNSTTKSNFILNDTQKINVGFYPGLYNSVYKIITDSDLFNNDVDNKDKSFWDKLKVSLDSSLQTKKPEGDINPYFSTFKITTDESDDFGPSNIGKYLVMPSCGFLPFQQAYYQVTTNGNNDNVSKEKVNVPQTFNGSTKVFWEAPNYGWFDNTKINKPNFNEYLKYVVAQDNQPEQFEFYLSKTKYSNIEDIFGVFDYNQLDLFENEFLEFSKEDGSSQLVQNSDIAYTNFKQLFKKMMIVEIADANNLSDISKKQSTIITETLNKFMEIPVYLKNGNPKKFDRINFGNFINGNSGGSGVTRMIPSQRKNYGNYVPNSIQTSKTNNDINWKTLKLYVGDSTISNLSLTDNSYVYDFFIDNNIAFTEQNIKDLSKLIKIYATQKRLNNGEYNSQRFKEDITKLMSDTYEKRTNIETQLRSRLSNLTNGTQNNEITINKYEGDETKLEMWELFKAINDKWVAGIDFKRRTIFEEFLFFDRANRDIGDDFIIKVDSVRKYCTWENSNTSVMNLISMLLRDNKMNFFVMPAYINFYGKPSKRFTTQNETILNNANDVFSTFGYVDYTSSAPKFLCQYIGRPSETLSMDNDPKYPFKSDSFDLGQNAGNPIRNTNPVTNQFNNNKAVGFVVDFGVTNQNVFTSFEISQNQNVTSSEQIQIVVDMGRLGGNKKTSQQTTALYELYKNRVYNSTIKTLGNVMIQPTMYFVIRHMPMFNGTYVIRNVKHSISPGNFETTFEGQRISALSNSKINNELASLNEDFTKKLNDKVKTLVSNNQLVVRNNSNQYVTGQDAKNINISIRIPYQGNIVTAIDSSEQTCNENLYGYPDSPQSKLELKDFNSRKVSKTELINLIRTNIEDKNMRLFLYSLFFLTGYDIYQNSFEIKLNNIFGATGDIQWNSLENVNGYRCLLTNERFPIPYLNFETLDKCLTFMNSYFKELLTVYLNDKTNFVCTTDDSYNPNNLDNDFYRTCITNIFVKLFYDKWYTSGSSTKYNENTSYNTWILNTSFILNEKQTKSLLI